MADHPLFIEGSGQENRWGLSSALCATWRLDRLSQRLAHAHANGHLQHMAPLVSILVGSPTRPPTGPTTQRRQTSNSQVNPSGVGFLSTLDTSSGLTSQLPTLQHPVEMVCGPLW
jgi:hypothetical protein